jgi:hypothetical protein
MVRTGGRLSLSTFGAADEESEDGTLYSTFEGLADLAGNLGGNADSFRPIDLYGPGRFFISRLKAGPNGMTAGAEKPGSIPGLYRKENNIDRRKEKCWISNSSGTTLSL